MLRLWKTKHFIHFYDTIIGYLTKAPGEKQVLVQSMSKYVNIKTYIDILKSKVRITKSLLWSE